MKYNKGCFPENNSSFTQIKSHSNSSSDVAVDCVFTLIPKSTPRIIRKCTRCGKDRFVSSDKFRVNANKKIIDIWLVFKCVECDQTLNVSIISRKSVATIEQALLERFHENDIDLAWQYAFDPAYIGNGLTVDWAIEFEVEPQTRMLCKNETNESIDTVSFLIQTRFFLKISTAIVLRKILNISRTQLEKMQAKGEIKIYTLQGKPMALKNSVGLGCMIKLINWQFS